MFRFLPPVLLLSVLTASAEPPLKAVPPTAGNSASRWAQQLGDRDYHTREQATRELDALGDAALPALEKVLLTGSPEATQRAKGLIARIQARAENARTIAGKIVDISLEDKPFSQALEELHRQSGFQIRINGDQALLSKTGSFVAKKEPFWTALDRFAESMGLVFDSATPQVAGIEARAPQLTHSQIVQRDSLQKQITNAKVEKLALENFLANTEKKLTKLSDEERKEKGPALQKLMTEGHVALKTKTQELLAMEAEFVKLVAAPPPAGTIILRSNGVTAPAPSTAVGALRIQAVPFPGQLPQVPREVIPLVLSVTPEPTLRLVRVTDAIITRAITREGQSLDYDPTTATISEEYLQQMQQLQFRRLGRGGRIRGDYYVEPVRVDHLGGFNPAPTQSLIRLKAPPGGLPSTKLTTLEGVLRAKVWSKVETIASIKSLSPDDQIAYGSNKTVLMAKLVPEPNDKTASILEVDLSYDASEINPQVTPLTNDSMTFEQLPGGGVRAVRGQAWSGPTRNTPQGLLVTDDSGSEYTMSLNMSRAMNFSFDPMTGMTRMTNFKMRYIVRGVKPETGPPTRISFNGLRLKEVDLHFKMSNVPVAAGTRDPNAPETPQPESGNQR